LKEPIKRFW